MVPNRHPLIIVVAIVIGFVALGWHGLPSDSYVDREAMLGTWTDESGPPGNSIRFYSVPTDLPGVPFVSAMEGHATVVNFLGETSAQGVWNYGSGDPLVLNLWTGKKMWFVAIQTVDRDHILARFGPDAEEMMRPGAILHPDARVLTRLADSAVIDAEANN